MMTPQEEADLYRARDRERRLGGTVTGQLTDEEITKLRSLITVRGENVAAWTSVKDSLPPSDGFYLVYEDEFLMSIPKIRRFSKLGKFQGCDRFISHWMPLPRPPKRGE